MGGSRDGGGRVEVINTGKGCSRLFVDMMATSSSSLGLTGRRVLRQRCPPLSPSAPSSDPSFVFPSTTAGVPFSGLVICVTGLSKEARKQVRDATVTLGGEYSPHLHPRCTHLVVQSSCGRKFEHALKHGASNGLFVVTLGWFVDSVRRKVRLSESLYSVKCVGEYDMPLHDSNQLYRYGAENACLPVGMLEHPQQLDMIGALSQPLTKECDRGLGPTLSGQSVHVDIDVSAELKNKVVQTATSEGATVVDQWFFGCNVSHVVCESSSVRKYLGYSSNLVTPLWVLKTAKEKRLQRLVHISADLARQVGMMLDNIENGICGEDRNVDINSHLILSSKTKATLEDRQKIVNLAKKGVRKRRSRHMQKCQTPIRPITHSSLLDSICWSISEPASSACVYTDSFSVGDASVHHTSAFFDANGDAKDTEASFINFTRPLTESEKSELIFKDHFLTILFPVDRFAEMGPCSRTFFCETGFTCLQLLDYIFSFYQENMSALEVEVAIHTDSRHADRLRSIYSSKETAELGYMDFKRIDFLGSRKSFEMLKRVSGDNNSNVYEFLIRS